MRSPQSEKGDTMTGEAVCPSPHTGSLAQVYLYPGLYPVMEVFWLVSLLTAAHSGTFFPASYLSIPIQTRGLVWSIGGLL